MARGSRENEWELGAHALLFTGDAIYVGAVTSRSTMLITAMKKAKFPASKADWTDPFHHLQS